MAMWMFFGWFVWMAGILFATAGSLNLPMFWAYIGVMVVISSLGYLWLYPARPRAD